MQEKKIKPKRKASPCYRNHFCRINLFNMIFKVLARDSLSSQAGDQAYVTNKGDGEWGLYLYTGSAWVQVSDADSANVDAATLTTTFTMPAGGFGTSTTQNLGNITIELKSRLISI